jgi:hypothetical protein
MLGSRCDFSSSIAAANFRDEIFRRRAEHPVCLLSCDTPPDGKWTSQAEVCGGQLALGERQPHIQSFHCYTTDSARAALGRLCLP